MKLWKLFLHRKFPSFPLEETKVQILNGTRQLFMKLGIKSVSMDDIASLLGMSKKTLYQHFPDKNDLVHATMSFQLEQITQIAEKAFDQSLSPIEQIITVGHCQCREMQHINPVLFFDLKKYYPKSMELFENHQRVYMREKMLDNIKKGIAQGYYRTDITPQLITEFYLSLINLITSGMNDYINSLDFSKVIHELVNYNLFAIATEKGKEIILKFKIPNEN